MKFNDFDFSLENEVWSVAIHDSAEDDSVIVVDFILDGNKYEDMDEFIAHVNQMTLKDKEILETLLISYFGFDEKEVEVVLKNIENI